LRPLLTDRDVFVRKAAIEGLGTLGARAKESVDDLEQVAANDSNVARRVGARVALIQVAGVSEERVRALAAFLELKNNLNDELTADEHQARKEAAAYAASALGDLGPKAKSAEAQLLAALKNPGLRGTAAYALGQIGANSPEAVTALIELLKNDPEREVRRSAAGALGALGLAAKDAIPALRAALKGDEKGGWWVAAEALAKIGGADVVPTLIEALANPNDDIRLTAMRGLGDLGAIAKPARMALEKACREETRKGNRVAAAEAVRKIEEALTPKK
jgi:HEAT repeat protein